jgi:hypothetical protein
VTHTQEANDSAEKGTSLKGGGDVARDISRLVWLDVKVALEAIASDCGAYKGRIVAKPLFISD